MLKNDQPRRQKEIARVALLNSETNPNKERVEAIRRWHIDQAVSEEKPVAILNITITADGMIHTKGLCIEPEHAQIMLPELQGIIERIEGQLQPAMPVLSLKRIR